MVTLNFTTAVLDPKITFTRSDATATVVNSSGVIQSVAANTPRFNYNPITLTCNGLLVEETRTNQIKYSGNFSQSSVWTVSRATIGATTITSPDNTSSGRKLIEDTTASNSHRVFQGYTTSAVATTYSVFAKAAERTWAYLTIADSGGVGRTAYFDLANGVLGSVGTNLTATITAFPNGWYRCTITVSAALAGTNNFLVGLAPANSSAGYTGDGTSGIYIWGAQLEVGTFATSYIPTTTTALTRNADIATITGSNFTSFWQASKGSTRVQVFPSTVLGIRPIVQFDDTTSNEVIALRGNTTNPELYIVDGGTPQAQINTGTVTANTTFVLAGTWEENNCKARLNEGVSFVDETATIPTVTQMRIGSDGTNYLNGHVAIIEYSNIFANEIKDGLNARGYVGTVTDMLLQYYKANGATSNSLTDAETQFLISKGFTTGTVTDKWFAYLRSLGYTGTVTDMLFNYWKYPA